MKVLHIRQSCSMRSETVSTCFLLIGLTACRERGTPVDRSAPAGQQTTAERPPASAQTATLGSVPAGVLAVCAQVAADWGRTPGIALHQVNDTLLLPEIGIEDAQTHACHVVAEDSLAFAASDSVRIGRDGSAKAAYWRNVARVGWVQLRWAADGPDGSTTMYQRGLVRCQLREEWDGGDDSDSTVIPSPFYRQTTSCWSHPAGIVQTDTMQ
jgi:hypothetical protein